jgi:8-oxo-dGTP pyrophosphatase MutT (NUDIX family)
MFDIRETGQWAPGQVLVRWTQSGRVIRPQVERAIEAAWTRESEWLGNKLFDGPMCRLESIRANPSSLQLTLSRTSYKPFLGTNLHNATLADEFGREVLANPVGLSTVLQTSDGWVLLGRRTDSVAYYPSRVHPFAGALEPHEELDVFAEVRRELAEELSLAGGEIAEMKCIGLVEDRALRQPELIFVTRSTLCRAAIEARLDRTEHIATYPIAPDRSQVERAMADPLLTPVAAATLTLWADRHLPPA